MAGGNLKRALKEGYDAEVEIYRIPSEKAEDELRKKLKEYHKKCASQSTLLFVHYSGHSSYRKGAGLSMTAFNPDSIMPFSIESPRLKWHTLQVGLEDLNTDVIVMLNSCESAGAVATNDRQKSKKRFEIIAASGAPGLSVSNDFTDILVRELADRCRLTEDQSDAGIPRPPFTVSSLYTGILRRTVRKYYNKGRYNFESEQTYAKFKEAMTPVHFTLKEGVNQSSICLSPVVPFHDTEDLRHGPTT